MVLRSLRGLLFSMLLGFHNAWEQDDAALDEVNGLVRVVRWEPRPDAFSRPERCFFWAASSLLN